jgi:hypothetical protein
MGIMGTGRNAYPACDSDPGLVLRRRRFWSESFVEVRATVSLMKPHKKP